jgi:hypothetical protein
MNSQRETASQAAGAQLAAGAQITVVHLVRHGEVRNPAGVMYGRLPGFHLSETGRQQASAAAAEADRKAAEVARALKDAKAENDPGARNAKEKEARNLQQQADMERQRADQERLRAEQLAAQLRELGVTPEEP